MANSVTATKTVEPTLEAAILDAARDLLAAGGEAGLSMRQLADHVGVSATAIYHYFESKQDLVNRVVRQAFDRFGSYLKDAMDSHPSGSLERLTAVGEGYLRFALENQAYFRVMFSIQPKDPESLEDLPEGGGYHLLRGAVSDAMEAGNVRVADPDLVSMYLWSSVHGLVTLALCGATERCRVEGIPSTLELFRAFASFFADGMRADGAKSDDKGEGAGK